MVTKNEKSTWASLFREKFNRYYGNYFKGGFDYDLIYHPCNCIGSIPAGADNNLWILWIDRKRCAGTAARRNYLCGNYRIDNQAH